MWKGSYENGSGGSGTGGTSQAQQAEKATTNSSSSTESTPSTAPGPDPNKLKAILDRTNYQHQVTAGQRKYGGPPPDWSGTAPPNGCEIFVGRIPKDIYEDELIPVFEKLGKLWDLRLMIDPVSAQSRGYAFITYCNKDDAQKAVQEMNGYKFNGKGYSIKVNISVPNLRLFIGNIPKVMSKDQIFNEFSKITEGLAEVITYSSPDDRKKNRGFCFLEFDSHKNASAAKRKLTTSGMKIFKCDILVDWADPQEEPDEETMSKVKVLYVRNLTADVSEAQLKELFEEHGTIERVKKIKDYAFVHFEERDQALSAMDTLNGQEFGGSNIEISLAKPPSDRRKKEEVLRNRERRMYMMMQQKQMLQAMAYSPRVAQPHPGMRAPMPAIAPIPPVMPPMPSSAPSASSGPSSGSSRSNRGGRFSGTPYGPMMPPTMPPFGRQNQPWGHPMMFYDVLGDWWYGGSGRPGAANSGPSGGGASAPGQFSYPAPPPNQWGYGMNGQVPQMSGPYSGRRSGPNANTAQNGPSSGGPSRKWRRSGQNGPSGGNKQKHRND